MSNQLELKGFAELEKKLDLLDDKLKGKVVRDAQKKALQPTLKEIKAKAPKRSGELKKSFGIVASFTSPEVNELVITNRRGKQFPHSHIAHMFEYGTVKMRARPWAEATFRSDITGILERFGRELSNKIEEIL